MSNLDGRRVRSLDDLPRVFKKPKRRQHDAKPNLSRTSLGHLPSEFILNERNLDSSKSGENDDDGSENFSKISDVPRLEINHVTEKNLTINTVDTPNFVDPLLEDKYVDDHQEYENDWEWKFKSNKRLLSWIDAVFALFLITPMIVGFWRGVWTLMDLHVQSFPQVLTFIFGTLLHMIFAIFRNCLHSRVDRAPRKKNCINKTFFKSLQILYTYVFGVACNAQWRGGWFIFDYYFGSHVWAITGVLVMLVTSLAILRSVRNVMAAPTVVLIDNLGFIFRFPTRYESGRRASERARRLRPESCMMSGASRLDQDWMRMVELRGGTGMTSGLSGRSSSRLHYTILTILDTVFSATVAAPAVVGYWRGTWGLSNVYVYPEDPALSSLTSILIGFVGLFVFNVTQNFLNGLLHPDKHRLSYYVGSRLYTAVFGFCCVNAWRGAWQALDLYTELTPSTVFAITAVSLLGLAILRAVRNISAPPFSLCLDSCPGYFEVQTMFRVNNTRDWSLYFLDCAFSVGVVGTLVVFVWRGVWILVDLYLFPDDQKYSSIGSIAIGYVIVTVTFCLQPLMRYVCTRLQGLMRLIIADGFLLLSFLGTVNVWRGIWNLLDLWLVPNNLELSCWITHVGCFVFLVLLNCSNSILVRGVYIDAEGEDGKCVAFPCHYFRLFFKVEREKKEARRRNLLVASKDFRPRPDGNTKDTENGALLPNSAPTTILPTNPESLV